MEWLFTSWIGWLVLGWLGWRVFAGGIGSRRCVKAGGLAAGRPRGGSIGRSGGARSGSAVAGTTLERGAEPAAAASAGGAGALPRERAEARLRGMYVDGTLSVEQYEAELDRLYRRV
jgi:hypothetical protein